MKTATCLARFCARMPTAKARPPSASASTSSSRMGRARESSVMDWPAGARRPPPPGRGEKRYGRAMVLFLGRPVDDVRGIPDHTDQDPRLRSARAGIVAARVIHPQLDERDDIAVVQVTHA